MKRTEIPVTALGLKHVQHSNTVQSLPIGDSFLSRHCRILSGHSCEVAFKGARGAQPGDDAVEVEDEHVGPEDVAAGHLVRFMRDAGAR